MGIAVDRDRFCALPGMTGHEAGIDGHGTSMASTSSVWCCAYFFSTDMGPAGV